MNHPSRSSFVAATAAAFIVGCGTDPMSDDGVMPLRDEIVAARVEVTRHHEVVLAASSYVLVLKDVGPHDAEISEIMGRMDGAMGGSTSHCSGPGMGHMHEMMGSMDGEMRAHGEAMTGAGTLEKARAQCTGHTDSMNDMLDRMHASLADVGCMSSR